MPPRRETQPSDQDSYAIFENFLLSSGLLDKISNPSLLDHEIELIPVTEAGSRNVNLSRDRFPEALYQLVDSITVSLMRVNSIHWRESVGGLIVPRVRYSASLKVTLIYRPEAKIPKRDAHLNLEERSIVKVRDVKSSKKDIVPDEIRNIHLFQVNQIGSDYLILGPTQPKDD